MNQLSCEVCMDLIPLVQDGVASPESRQAVENHVALCPACRALYQGTPPPAEDEEQLLHQIRRRFHLLACFLLFLAMFLGISLANSEDQFYNALLMPLIGALGYTVYRWKALYQVPFLLLILHAAMLGFQLLRGVENLSALFSLLWWTALFSLFSDLGTLIAGLFHYAFGKETST